MPEQTDCSLCGMNCRRVAGADEVTIACPKCGTYWMTGSVEGLIRGRPPQERERLTFLTRTSYESGRMVRFNTGNIDEFVRASPDRGTSLDRLDRLLLYVLKKSPMLGGQVSLDFNVDAPAVLASSAEEIGKLFNAASDELHWLKHARTGVGVQVTLTVEGMRRAIALQNVLPRSEQAFVAMSFDSELLPAFQEGIEPALRRCGFSVVRVDRVQHNEKIDDEIVAGIRSSSLIVADFTLQRTGVYFEAGLGLGLGLKVIWTCRDTDSEELGKHFDTRQYNHILWADPADLNKRLTDRIRATVSLPVQRVVSVPL